MIGRGPNRRHGRRPADAFTLIEVILAVGITAGLLLVALFFHQQTVVLRNALLDEATRVTSVRQIMARLTRELAAMAPEAGALQGDSRSIEFIYRKPPPPLADSSTADLDGLVRLRYESLIAAETQESGPLRRTESPLATAEPEASPVPESGSVYNLLELESDDASSAPEGAEFGGVQFAWFRYFDGESWVESWSGGSPPLGVEVVLGFQPGTEDLTIDDYPYESFRRTIALLTSGPVDPPSGAGATPATDPAAEGSGGDWPAEDEPPAGMPEFGETESAPPAAGRGGRPFR